MENIVRNLLFIVAIVFGLISTNTNAACNGDDDIFRRQMILDSINADDPTNLDPDGMFIFSGKYITIFDLCVEHGAINCMLAFVDEKRAQQKYDDAQTLLHKIFASNLDKDAVTPLVLRIIEFGGDMKAENNAKETPEDYARANGFRDVLKSIPRNSTLLKNFSSKIKRSGSWAKRSMGSSPKGKSFRRPTVIGFFSAEPSEDSN